jgi:hypothetical protein
LACDGGYPALQPLKRPSIVGVLPSGNVKPTSASSIAQVRSPVANGAGALNIASAAENNRNFRVFHPIA